MPAAPLAENEQGWKKERSTCPLVRTCDQGALVPQRLRCPDRIREGVSHKGERKCAGEVSGGGERGKGGGAWVVKGCRRERRTSTKSCSSACASPSVSGTRGARHTNAPPPLCMRPRPRARAHPRHARRSAHAPTTVTTGTGPCWFLPVYSHCCHLRSLLRFPRCPQVHRAC